MATEQHISNELHGKEFQYRLDFYWQATAVYAVALLMYAFLKGTISAGSLTLELFDPIVLLLGTVVVISALASLINWYMQRSVEIGETFIRFRNRFRTRTFLLRDISALGAGKKRRRQMGSYKIIKIRLHNRRRFVRLRPSLYEHENELVQALLQLKRRLQEAQA